MKIHKSKWNVTLLVLHLVVVLQFSPLAHHHCTAHAYRRQGLAEVISPAKFGVQLALSRYGATRTSTSTTTTKEQATSLCQNTSQWSETKLAKSALAHSAKTQQPSGTRGIACLVNRQKKNAATAVSSADSNYSNLDIVSHNDADEQPKIALTTGGAQSRGKGSSAKAADNAGHTKQLAFWETMLCGAISRSTAQTIMHPANTMKTMLQNSKGPVIPAIMELMKPSSFRRLTYGAGTNFLLSVPNGALNFSVLEFVRKQLGNYVASNPYLSERSQSLGAGLDFVSSSVSTVVCSIVATPQMMITDNIMAGNYPNLFRSVQGLAQSGGIRAFYRGWLPGMAGKIPSYALTWTLFQQFKTFRDKISDRPARNIENSIMGCLASATSVCVMIPMDTIKTRLVTQGGAASITRVPYKGIIDCAVRVYREEGIGAFYRSLPPRLVSVVPLIGIQFGVYEAMKKFMMMRKVHREPVLPAGKVDKKIAKKKPAVVVDAPVVIDKIEAATPVSAGLD
ncbi:hypothetical protein ACA910_004935 [Epithemia clementina (nom. ined.)]